MARLGVPVGGRVRKLRAVEDQSAPIPEEIMSECGGSYFYAAALQNGQFEYSDGLKSTWWIPI